MANTPPAEHYLYFVRHGQSHGNASGEEIKPEDNFLTDLGKRQAQVLGDFFKSKDIKFHRAYSSHYPRALGTGHGILEQIHGSGPDKIELCVDPRIREREAGTLVGTGAEEIWKTFREKLRQGKKVYEIDFHGEEDSSASFIQRQKSFMKELVETMRADDKPTNTLIISHGITLKGLMDAIMDGIFSDVVTHRCGEGFEELKQFPWSTQNTSVTKLSIQYPPIGAHPAVLTFHEVNSIHHMTQDMAQASVHF